MQNEIAYSRPVTLTNILRFAVPTIAMSVFMSFYTMVDGLFVSNLIGTSALSALNLVYPVIALVTAISTMLATGGSAAIMRKMGEGKPDEAKQDFTFLILVNVLTGLVMCGLGYLFMGKIFGSMSLSPEVSAYCWEYLSRYLLFTVPILLMNNFTLYMIAAGKASLSLLCSVAGGVTNIVLDYLFIAVSAGGSAGRRLPPAWGTPSQPSWACWCSPTGTACSILSGRSAGPKRSGEPSRTAALKWPPRWSTASSR